MISALVSVFVCDASPVGLAEDALTLRCGLENSPQFRSGFDPLYVWYALTVCVGNPCLTGIPDQLTELFDTVQSGGRGIQGWFAETAEFVLGTNSSWRGPKSPNL